MIELYSSKQDLWLAEASHLVLDRYPHLMSSEVNNRRKIRRLQHFLKTIYTFYQRHTHSWVLARGDMPSFASGACDGFYNSTLRVASEHCRKIVDPNCFCHSNSFSDIDPMRHRIKLLTQNKWPDETSIEHDSQLCCELSDMQSTLEGTKRNPSILPEDAPSGRKEGG